MLEPTIPFLTYKVARDRMQTGDVILWKGNSILGRLIRLWTPFNHASLIVRLEGYEGRDGERRYIMEALEGGIDLNLLSASIRGYDGEAWWFPLKSKYDSQRNFIREYALDNCTAKYDYNGLLSNALGRISPDAQRYICSEFILFAWADAGVLWLPEKVPRPGDIPNLGVTDWGVRIEV